MSTFNLQDYLLEKYEQDIFNNLCSDVSLVHLYPYKTKAEDYDFMDLYKECEKKVKALVAEAAVRIQNIFSDNLKKFNGYEEITRETSPFVNEEIDKMQPFIKDIFKDLQTMIDFEETKKSQLLQEQKENQKQNEIEKERRINKILNSEDSFGDMGSIKIPYKTRGRSLCLAMYRGDKFYFNALKAEVDLNDFHMSDREMAKIMDFLKAEMNRLVSQEPIEIHLGHEHGNVSGKCHYIVCLFFSEPINKQFKQMLQYASGPSLYALYEFFFLEPTHASSARNYVSQKIPLESWKKEQKEGYPTVNGSMSTEDFIQHMRKVSMRDLINNGHRMVSNFKAFVQEKDLPEFKWIWPKHLDEEPYKLEESVQKIKLWFLEFCVGEPFRKKALFLFSEERGIGKTMFASSLVNDPEYLIHNKYVFNAEPFQTHSKAKLVLLDDMKYKKAEQELWKAMTAGDTATIRSPYFNFFFDKRVPTIICSNDLELLDLFLTHKDFKNQVTSIVIDTYLGPPGTRPRFLVEDPNQSNYLPDNILNKLRNKKKINAFNLLGKKRK